MAKLKAKQSFIDPDRGPLFSVRFAIAILLMLLGIAWIVVYYTVVRVDPTTVPAPKPGGPAFMGNMGNWNYVVGFGLLFVGLLASANPQTPLGRGRGVVVGMLSCFILGLLWICTYYVFADKLDNLWVFNDLSQWNLAVGIGFMAVGFSFATRWE